MAYGGTNRGLSPYGLLSAGLGACTSMTIRMYARHKKWPLDHVSVDVSHDKVHAQDAKTAVGDKIDVICEGGIQRGTHVLKALSVGAKAVSGGRLYLYALAAAGQAGVERALGNLRTEIERDMKLMGAKSVADLHRGNLRWR